MITETAFAAVRKNEESTFIDITTISCLPEISRKKAEKMDSDCPSYGEANKIQRIVSIDIVEKLETGY